MMKRHRIYLMALVLFFLLYGLSPLTYDLSAKSISSDSSRATSKRSLRNASIYIVEVLCEAFSPPDEDEPENDSSPNRVLIAKKSAVHRGKFDIVPQSGRIPVIAPADPRPYSSIETERAEIRWSWDRKSSGCLSLSSGLSPPCFL
jgi:hypothetical protein